MLLGLWGLLHTGLRLAPDLEGTLLLWGVLSWSRVTGSWRALAVCGPSEAGPVLLSRSRLV